MAKQIACRTAYHHLMSYVIEFTWTKRQAANEKHTFDVILKIRDRHFPSKTKSISQQ